MACVNGPAALEADFCLRANDSEISRFMGIRGLDENICLFFKLIYSYMMWQVAICVKLLVQTSCCHLSCIWAPCLFLNKPVCIFIICLVQTIWHYKNVCNLIKFFSLIVCTFIFAEILCCIGVGLNVPELQARMLFSTQCWSCNQHSLPIIHYLHSGADVIWCVTFDSACCFSVCYWYSLETLSVI